MIAASGCTLGPDVERPVNVTKLPIAVGAPNEVFDIENCAAAQGTTLRDDHLYDNRTLCYQTRAERLNEWSSCLELGTDPSISPATCLADITLRSQVYVCDKHSDPAVVQQCNEMMMVEEGTNSFIHQVAGLENYRIEKTTELNIGESFNVAGVAVTLDSKGQVVLPDYYPSTSHICRPHEDPPLSVGTGVQGAYIYVTGCTAVDTSIKIDYFRYDLPGLVFPAQL